MDAAWSRSRITLPFVIIKFFQSRQYFLENRKTEEFYPNGGTISLERIVQPRKAVAPTLMVPGAI